MNACGAACDAPPPGYVFPPLPSPSIGPSRLRRLRARHASAGRITAGDLARLAAAVWSDPEIRHRLALDGVPIADGAVIVRATSPLIALTAPPFAPPNAAAREVLADAPPAPATIASSSRDGLDLLAVASGPASEREVWNVLVRGFERYERVTVVRSGQRVGREIVVRGGSIARFGAVAAEPFALTAPRRGREAWSTRGFSFRPRSKRRSPPIRPSASSYSSRTGASSPRFRWWRR